MAEVEEVELDEDEREEDSVLYEAQAISAMGDSAWVRAQVLASLAIAAAIREAGTAIAEAVEEGLIGDDDDDEEG